MSVSPRTKAIVRQQAIRAMCHGPDGKLSKNARLIAAYLSRECNGKGQFAPPTTNTGGYDPIAIGIAMGRRQVFDLLARMLNIDLKERSELSEDL